MSLSVFQTCSWKTGWKRNDFDLILYEPAKVSCRVASSRARRVLAAVSWVSSSSQSAISSSILEFLFTGLGAGFSARAHTVQIRRVVGQQIGDFIPAHGSDNVSVVYLLSTRSRRLQQFKKVCRNLGFFLSDVHGILQIPRCCEPTVHRIWVL